MFCTGKSFLRIMYTIHYACHLFIYLWTNRNKDITRLQNYYTSSSPHLTVFSLPLCLLFSNFFAYFHSVDWKITSRHDIWIILVICEHQILKDFRKMLYCIFVMFFEHNKKVFDSSM